MKKISTKKLSLIPFNIAIFFLVASFLSILVVNNCSPHKPSTEMDAVLEAKEALEIIYASGDSRTNVRYDVTLLTATNNVTIAWEVSNNAFLSESGKVTRPEFARGDQRVILEARLSRGIASATKTFDPLTVIALPDPDIATVSNSKRTLFITYTNGENSNAVSNHVILATKEANGVGITWMSSAPNVIATNGRVSRPSHIEGTTEVTLTASLFKGMVTNTKRFILTVIALPDPDIATISNARDALIITYTPPDTDSNSVTTNVILTPNGANGVGIAWMSSAPNVIATNGRVSRPSHIEGTIEVTLTASLFKGMVTNTKRFILTVIALPDPDIATVSNARDALTIIYTLPDTDSNSVTTNVILAPNGANGVGITWMSSAPNIATNGDVLRPSHIEGTIEVTLTASLFKGAVTNAKPFILTVMALPDPDIIPVSNARDALMISYTPPDTDSNSVTTNVILPTNGANGVGITWMSSHPNFISTNGEVTRPSHTEGTTNVLLSASLFKGMVTQTKTFTLTVIPSTYYG